MIAARPKSSIVEDLGVDDALGEIRRHHDVVNAGVITPATREPRVPPSVGMKHAKCVNETMSRERFGQLAPCRRVRLFRAEARRDV
ncbi:MAG: hypothetical protein QM831_11700 [Kofleriaceae bacterium]